MIRARAVALGLATVVLWGCADTTAPSTAIESSAVSGQAAPTASAPAASAATSPRATPVPSSTPTPQAGPIAGTWRVRKVLTVADRTGLVPGAAYADEAYAIATDCPVEPCAAITVRATPLGHASPVVETTLERDGDTYVSAAAALPDGPCLEDGGGQVPGGASIASTLRLWIATVRPAGTAVESTRLMGTLQLTLTPTPIGAAAGCEARSASYDLSGRREAIAVIDDGSDDGGGRDGDGDTDAPDSAGRVALPRIGVKVTGATIDYFGVRGDTVEELAVSVARGGVRACGEINYEWFEGDARPSACVVTRFLDWEEAIETRTDADGDCTITDADVTARFIVHFPRWTRPSRVPERLLDWWRDIVAFIRDHEAGHVKIGRDYVKKLNARLDGADCTDASSIITAWARQLTKAQEAFDRREYDEPWPEPPRGY